MGQNPFGSGFRTSTWNWISANLKKKKVLKFGMDLPWNILFSTIIWQIWKDQNRKSFDNFDSVPEVSSKVICAYASEFVEASFLKVLLLLIPQLID